MGHGEIAVTKGKVTQRQKDQVTQINLLDFITMLCLRQHLGTVQRACFGGNGPQVLTGWQPAHSPTAIAPHHTAHSSSPALRAAADGGRGEGHLVRKSANTIFGLF